MASESIGHIELTCTDWFYRYGLTVLVIKFKKKRQEETPFVTLSIMTTNHSLIFKVSRYS